MFLAAAALLQKPYNDFFKVAVASAGNHDNNIYNDGWSETYHGLKEVSADAAAKDGKEIPKKTIQRIRPIEEDEDDPQDKKGEAKKDDSKGDVKKAEEKKSEAKSVDTKKAEAKKDDAKKEDTKKGEVKTSDAKEEVKKGDAKANGKVEAKATPKTKFEIKIPTNAELAANLKGHILLVHGDMDNNVHPANTIRLVDALIKANKRFDMLIMPGKAHGFGDYQPYFTQRMWEYFAEYLLNDRQTSADMNIRTPSRR